MEQNMPEIKLTEKDKQQITTCKRIGFVLIAIGIVLMFISIILPIILGWIDKPPEDSTAFINTPVGKALLKLFTILLPIAIILVIVGVILTNLKAIKQGIYFLKNADRCFPIPPAEADEEQDKKEETPNRAQTERDESIFEISTNTQHVDRCHYCGAVLKETDKRCPGCGARRKVKKD